MIWVRPLFDNIIWWHFSEIELSETQSMWDVNTHFWIVPASKRWKVLFLSINVSLFWFCFMQSILFLVAAHSYSKCLHVDNNAECPIIMCELTEPASVWLLYLISIELSSLEYLCARLLTDSGALKPITEESAERVTNGQHEGWSDGQSDGQRKYAEQMASALPVVRRCWPGDSHFHWVI